MNRISTLSLALALALCALTTEAAAQGGPDAFGYTWDFTTYDWVDLNPGPGTLVAGLSSDDAEANVPLPFSFPYYGGSYSTVRVADNGALVFTTTATTSITYSNACLPTSAANNTPDIAVYWDDLVSSNKVYSYDDVAGGRFIISWEEAAHYSGGGAVSFQVHLYPSGRIEHHYSDVHFGATAYDNGASATIGIQDRTGGTFSSGNVLQASCNSAGVVSAGSALAFESCLDADGDGYPGPVCGGIDCDDSDPTVYPGAPEICGDGMDQDCDGADAPGDADGDGYDSVACGGDDCDDADPSINPGQDNDGDGWHACEDCDDADAAINPGQDADGDGFDVCEDCDDGDPSIYPGAPEVCDGLDNDCDGVPGNSSSYTSPPDNTSSDATGYFRGGKFLAASDTAIAGLAIDLTAPVGSTIDFAVYEASSEAGSYSLVASSSVMSASSARGWHESGPLAVPVSAGSWYVLGATWSATGTFYYRSSSSVSFPYSATWGSHEGGASSNTFGGVLPASHSFSTSGTSYNVRVVVTSTDEADVDGDGQPVCAGDCDDADPATYPGAPEVCDGLDNDCDGAVPAAEADGDGDGAALCDGDCDDGAPTVYPGAPELCDGLDNDCDGAVASDELVDDDGDGSPICIDCDDADAAVYPGAPELCDGLDNDCDGLIGGGGVSIFESDVSAGGFSGANRFRGNYFLAGSDATITAIEARLDPPSGGATFEWVVYEAASATGTYTKIHGSSTTTTAGAADWYASGPISVGLQAGSYYTIGTWWSSSYGVGYWNGPMGADDPSWGDHIGGMTFNGGLSAAQSFDTSTSAYPTRIQTGTLGPPEVDADGDGFLACEECDDADPTVSPGGVELCNGLDDDCDGVVPSDEVDADGDGWWPCDGDCEDADPLVYPGAPEVCDGADDDCDGVLPAVEVDVDADGWLVCEGDCDDADPAIRPGVPEQCDGLDGDCDGLVPPDEVDADGDGWMTCAGDCDDTEPATWPGAPELCDGLDNDCDGSAETSVDDVDGDGFSGCSGDCDDSDASIFPGAPELCDGQDNDCSGLPGPDEADADGDGVRGCAGDCDDADPAVYAGAAELCDGLDNDCSGAPDADPAGEVDGDGDGWLSCADCDDADPATSPGAVEVCDGQDNDCDPSTDEAADEDGDGFTACTGDCDDADPNRWPGAAEVCDDLDSDCDGDLVDGFDDSDGDLEPDCVDEDDDDDGDPDVTDCAPLDDQVFDGAAEVCDGLDSDCDGDLVDGFPDADGDGEPNCIDEDDDGDGDPDATDCAPLDDQIFAGAVEACDLVDSDCDGDLVDGFVDTDGDGLPDCAEEDSDGDGVLDLEDCAPTDPEIHPGADEVPDDDIDQDCSGADTVTCFEDEDEDGYGGDEVLEPGGDCIDAGLSEEGDDCDDDDPLSYPEAPELCDGVDNDCDLDVDEGFESLDWYLDADGDGAGDPDQPFVDNPSCDEPEGYVTDAQDCDDGDPAVHPGAEELCDGLDNDCDGGVPVEEEDADGDGFELCAGDCDDDDPDAWPGAEETCGDTLDGDCDGTEDFDAGWDDPECWSEGCSVAGGGAPPVALVVLLIAGLLLRDRRRCRKGLPLLALGLALGLPGLALADGEEEARRQIEFARGELDEGRADRALKSAESALRLCPSCYDAMVVKALAHEALGDLKLAESLLMTYLDLIGPELASEEAKVGLARVQTVGEPPTDEGGSGGEGEPAEVTTGSGLATLTVRELPAGAAVEIRSRAAAEGGEAQTLTLPVDVGEIDPDTGVRLAPPATFDDLQGGLADLTVSHPTLGDAPMQLVLEPGGVNGGIFPWREMEGVSRVQAAYEVWRTFESRAQAGRNRTAALAVVSGVLAGGGAALMVGAAVQKQAIIQAKADGIAAPDENSLQFARVAHRSAEQAQLGMIGGGSVGLGLGGVGLVMTIISGAAAKEVVDPGPWHPEWVD